MIFDRDKKLKSITYYSLHANSLCINVRNLTRYELSTSQNYLFKPWVADHPII